MNSLGKEVGTEILPYIRVYKDGSVERLRGSPIVPPSPHDPETGVSSKDITVSETPPISARIYLPKLHHNSKLPLLVCFHGGGFCFESAFSFVETKFRYRLACHAKAVVISIEYRLAPEHPLPIAYQDCWAGLQWVASHYDGVDVLDNKEPWLSSYVDFDRVYVCGDSAGANLAHNVLMRAGSEDLNGGAVKIKGAIITHPFFWGSKPVGLAEPQSVEEREKHAMSRTWRLVYPTAPGGIDNPMVNFLAEGAPSLAGLGCSKLLISVAGDDMLRDRGILYYDSIKQSGWRGEVELVQVEGEDHAFQIDEHEKENALKLIKRLASFVV